MCPQQLDEGCVYRSLVGGYRLNTSLWSKEPSQAHWVLIALAVLGCKNCGTVEHQLKSGGDSFEALTQHVVRLVAFKMLWHRGLAMSEGMTEPGSLREERSSEGY